MITRKNYKMSEEDKNLILFLEGEDMRYPISKMREDKQKYYEKNKIIYSIDLAQYLLKLGNKITDILHDEEKEECCVFAFRKTKKLQNDLIGINTVQRNILNAPKSEFEL